MKGKIIRFNLFLGLGLFIISAILLMLELPFMKTWFYCFAWWSFILVMDSVNFRTRRHSPLSESTRNFMFTAFISVFVWLLFELFNLRVKNWSYHNLPSSAFERWLGYFIAYASVIPALREVSFFLESFLEGKKLALFRIKANPFFLKLYILIGVLFMFLSLFRPGLFFPLIWLCFMFLLEPVNYWLKNESLLRDQERKDWSRIWSWILAGLVAGFLWELFNFWAGSHWEYSLPYLDFWRVFQMPVFGYTGFMPFALEVFIFYQFLSRIYREFKRRIFIKSLFFVFLAIFYLGCFYLIDTFTLIK
jgi:hypothetical protein